MCARPRVPSGLIQPLRAAMAVVDILLAPATPVTAPKIGQEKMTIGGTETPVRPNLGIFTQPISFVGLPVAVAPRQRPGALPIGVQIVARPWGESDALRVAFELERRGIAESLYGHEAFAGFRAARPKIISIAISSTR